MRLYGNQATSSLIQARQTTSGYLGVVSSLGKRVSWPKRSMLFRSLSMWRTATPGGTRLLQWVRPGMYLWPCTIAGLVKLSCSRDTMAIIYLQVSHGMGIIHIDQVINIKCKRMFWSTQTRVSMNQGLFVTWYHDIMLGVLWHQIDWLTSQCWLEEPQTGLFDLFSSSHNFKTEILCHNICLPPDYNPANPDRNFISLQFNGMSDVGHNNKCLVCFQPGGFGNILHSLLAWLACMAW